MQAHPDEAAGEIERMPLEEAADLLAELPSEAAAAMASRLAAAFAAECVRRIPGETAGELLARMPRDSAALLLRRLPAADRDRLLALTPRDAAAALSLLARFPEDTAGALMDPEVLSVPADIPVREALDRVRRTSSHVLYYVYVVNRGGGLVGVVNLRELMSADADAVLRDVMRSPVARLSVYADRVGALAHPGWRTFYALPVADDAGLLVGVLRHKRLHASEDGLTPESGDLLSIGVSLGEMYWTVAARLLQSLWSPVGDLNGVGMDAAEKGEKDDER
jgi:magnesium transporter